MVMNIVQQHFPNPTDEGDFIGTTASTLATLGFTGENTLPIIAVCRDEICASFVSTAEKHWGNSFTLGGLAGLPFAGKTGMGAASHHAPDIHDRERFVIYAMAHIGFGPDGEVGGCVRPAWSISTVPVALLKPIPVCFRIIASKQKCSPMMANLACSPTVWAKPDQLTTRTCSR